MCEVESLDPNFLSVRVRCRVSALGGVLTIFSSRWPWTSELQIAIVFDFLGAILLGRVVTSTIASGVADINAFIGNPEVYAYGMICACTAGSFWLAVASRIGVNVSGTHFIGKHFGLSRKSRDLKLITSKVASIISLSPEWFR